MKHFGKEKMNKNLETDILNADTYDTIYRFLINIWKSRFHWDVAGIPSETIESIYMSHGGCAFVYDNVIGNIVPMRWTTNGIMNVYDEPSRLVCDSINGMYHWNGENFVFGFSNADHSIPLNTIIYYAHRIYEVVRTTDINLDNQKTPKILKSTTNKRLSLNNIVSKIENFISYIEVKEDLGDALSVLDLSSPYIGDKLADHYNNYMDRFLTFCCIDNSAEDKKERLISLEAESQLKLVQMLRRDELRRRKKVCRDIEGRWGIPASVEWIGGESIGSIYDNSPRVGFRDDDGNDR